MRIKTGKIAGIVSVSVGVILSMTPAHADDDALRDLGATAAPGEVPRYDGAQWRNAHDNLGVSKIIPGPGLMGGGTNEDVTVSVDFGTSDTNNAVARQSYVDATMPPVGSVVAWVKSFPNVPTNIPPKWVECNGQMLSDGDSPLGGQTIPDLNGDKRFLYGDATSGTEASQGASGSASHNHTYGWNGTAATYYTSTAGCGHSHPMPNYSVVWIMRVK